MTSIWLQPEGRQDQELQDLIERLAAAHHTVSFRPHLTVCSVTDDPAVLDAAAAYIRECGLLPLKVAKTAVTGVRRDKAALSSGCKAHPAIRSSRKQSEQSWR